MTKQSDIVFVNPPWHKERGNIWRKVAGVVPPLGLAYLAAVAERRGLRAQIIDAQALGLTLSQTAERISASPARWYGFTATTPIVNGAYKLARHAEKTHPHARIIMGGPHVSALPDEPFERLDNPVVVRGEAELTLDDLLQDKPLHDMQGVSFLADGEIVHNPVRPLIQDLDTLPFPAYHLLPVKNYHPSLGNYRIKPALSIIATRGCYGRCTFCYREIFGNVVRTRSNRLIIEELKLLRNKYGIRDISFYDDIFLGTKKKIRDFCEQMIKEKLDVIWLCNLRSELTDPDLLKLMRRAGCYMVDYGVESGSQDMLESMKKNAELERTMECIRMARRAGMDIKCGFIIGSPGETPQSMKATLDIAMKIRPDTAMFNISTPFPGTEIYKQAEAEHTLTSRDWDLYDYSHVLVDQPGVSVQQIEEFYKTVYRKFYLRPSYIAERLFKMRSAAHLRMAVEAFFAIFGLVFLERKQSAI